MDWKTDREWLRNEVKRTDNDTTTHTLLCALIAHTRGKIHMKYFNKYHGGWRSYGEPKENRKFVPDEECVNFERAYGQLWDIYYNMAIINDLDDQAEWIHKMVNKEDRQYSCLQRKETGSGWTVSYPHEAYRDIAQRVLEGYNDSGACQQAL